MRYAFNNPLVYVDPDGDHLVFLLFAGMALFAGGHTLQSEAAYGNVNSIWGDIGGLMKFGGSLLMTGAMPVNPLAYGGMNFMTTIMNGGSTSAAINSGLIATGISLIPIAWYQLGEINVPSSVSSSPEKLKVFRSDWYRVAYNAIDNFSLFNIDPKLAMTASSGMAHFMSYGLPGGRSGGSVPRPDIDGFLTFDEAVHWYKWGKGEPLYVDLSKLDLSSVSPSDFDNPSFYKWGRPGKYINFQSKAYRTSTEQGLIYGHIGLVYLGDRNVIALPDVYDFDFKLRRGSFRRDILTMFGIYYHGYGNPYVIHFYNIGKIGK